MYLKRSMKNIQMIIMHEIRKNEASQAKDQRQHKKSLNTRFHFWHAMNISSSNGIIIIPLTFIYKKLVLQFHSHVWHFEHFEREII